MAARSALRPRKRPRQARSRATVEAILEAAARIFRQHGYAAGTTDRIAEKAGVSIGTLYQYFPNKDALLVALAERHIDAGFARVRELLDRSAAAELPLESLVRRFVEAMIALHAHEPELHRVLFEEAPLPASLRRSLRQRELALAGEVRAVLEAQPGVCMGDPMVSAYVVVQTIEGLVHGFILHPPAGIDAEALADEIVAMICGYLAGG
ncbi:MAG: TetR/AcrR family transcriptional regulator [Myxococcota bacterium]